MGGKAITRATLAFIVIAGCGTTDLSGEPDSTADIHTESDSTVTDTWDDEPEEPVIPDETWVLYTGADFPRRYGRKFTETRDGGLAFAGFSEEDKVWIVKLDSEENIEWSEYVDGSWYPEGIAESPGGNLVVAGPTISIGSGGEDAWLLEIDAEGNPLKERAIGTSLDERALSLAALQEGGYVLMAGRGSSPWIARLDNELDIVWKKWFPDVSTFYGAVAVTRSGDILVAGDNWLARLDPDGSIIWQRSITGGSGGPGLGVAEMTDGDIALTVSSGGVAVLRFDDHGTLLWQRSYGGDWTWALTHGDFGQVLVAGGISEGDANMWMLGLDTDGSVIWQKQALIPSVDSAYDMRRTSDGAVVTLSGGCCTTGVVKLRADGTFFGDCYALVDTHTTSAPASLVVEEAIAVADDIVLTVTDSEPTVIDTPAERVIACRGP